jgi:hypothetical protein
MGNKVLNNSMIFIIIGFFGIFITLAVGLNLDYNFNNLATFGLCLLTGIYAFATILLVFENRKTIKEMQQSRLDTVKPAFSLQPGGFVIGGGFNELFLVNSGGVARNVKVDLQVTDPVKKELLFFPTIDSDHRGWLQVGDVQNTGGIVRIKIQYKDSYSQNFSEDLEINFSELVKEGRMIKGQSSAQDRIFRVLEGIQREIGNIERKIK